MTRSNINTHFKLELSGFFFFQPDLVRTGFWLLARSHHVTRFIQGTHEASWCSCNILVELNVTEPRALTVLFLYFVKWQKVKPFPQIWLSYYIFQKHSMICNRKITRGESTFPYRPRRRKLMLGPGTRIQTDRAGREIWFVPFSLRAGVPTQSRLLYSDDCGARLFWHL